MDRKKIGSMTKRELVDFCGCSDKLPIKEMHNEALLFFLSNQEQKKTIDEGVNSYSTHEKTKETKGKSRRH